MAGKRAAVNHLDRHLANYLRLRRALGFRLAFPGHVLPGLVAYLGAAGASTVTTEHAVAWARLPAGVQPIAWAHRLGAARGFARYLHTIDPATEVPPRDVFAAHQQRPVPHIWSYAEVRALLHAAGELHPSRRAATYTTLFGLLAVSGLRIGEAIALPINDVDLRDGVVTITHAKSGRSRLVPLHPSAIEGAAGLPGGTATMSSGAEIGGVVRLQRRHRVASQLRACDVPRAHHRQRAAHAGPAATHS